MVKEQFILAVPLGVWGRHYICHSCSILQIGTNAKARAGRRLFQCGLAHGSFRNAACACLRPWLNFLALKRKKKEKKESNQCGSKQARKHTHMHKHVQSHALKHTQTHARTSTCLEKSSKGGHAYLPQRIEHLDSGRVVKILLQVKP